jgi:hypothetical protein
VVPGQPGVGKPPAKLKLMPNLTTKTARQLAAKRKTYGAGTGRPRIPTPCPRCGEMCKSARLAHAHDCR